MIIDFSVVWGSYFISVPLILATVWAGTKYLSKKYVDQKFNKKLETHKHELQTIMEFNKFDIQRKIQDFNLYTVKKHEVYLTLYRLFHEADGYARGMYGLRHVPDYKNHTSSEISKILDESEVGEERKKYFLERWESRYENSSIVDEFSKLMDRIRVNMADEQQKKAHNEWIYSKLYLSENVDELCSELSNLLWQVCWDLHTYYDQNVPGQDKVEPMKSIKENNEKISSLLVELKNEMQKELSIGYYK